jgi:hypothetical protein
MIADAEGVSKCVYNGQTYVEGQKFYPTEEPCMTCTCKAGFAGEKCGEREREREGIPIYHSYKLQAKWKLHSAVMQNAI